MFNYNNQEIDYDNPIQVFYSEVFGNIRGKMIEGKPYVSGTDIARCLGYSKTRNAILQHVKECNKITAPNRGGIPGNPNMVFINEAGVNDLILASRMPKAQELKSWITGTVMPNIREFGAHLNSNKIERMIEDPYYGTNLALALKEAEKKNEMLEEEKALMQKRMTQMTYRQQLYGYLMESGGYYCTTTIANDYGFDVISFNSLLQQLGVQHKGFDRWYLDSKYEGLGYTTVASGYDEDGNEFKYMAWTNKGRIFLFELLRSCGYMPIVNYDNCPFYFAY